MENWIKILEIELSSGDLSREYEKISNNEEIDEQSLEKLVRDNYIVQELTNNAIPYKCKWEDRIAKNPFGNIRMGTVETYHYYIGIFIQENDIPRYNEILKSFEIDEEESQEENTKEENEEVDKIEKRHKTMRGIRKMCGMIAILFLIGGIIYTILQAMGLV